jgi:hypothetical protein
MEPDLETPRFGAADASFAAGIDPATLQTWANRNLLEPSGGLRNPGSGGRRRYSGCDLIRFGIMRHLVETFFTPQAAAAMCRPMFSEVGDACIRLLGDFADPSDYMELTVVFSRPYPAKPTDAFACEYAVVDPELEDSWATQLGKKIGGKECIALNVGPIVREVMAKILAIDAGRL